MARIISFFNQKGGVGKTTSAINLSAAVANKRKKVLVIDVDPQGNLTSGYGADATSGTLYHVLSGKKDAKDVIVSTSHKNVDIIPGSTDTAGLEIEFAISGDWQYKLREVCLELAPRYDYIFLDLPPSLGILSIMALNASGGIISTIQSEYYALEGLSHLLKTVDLVRENYNSGIEIAGVLITMYDSRNNLSREVVNEVRSFFEDVMFENVIPRSIKLAEAPGYGLSILDYDENSQGAKAYLALAKEFLDREKRRN